MIGLIVTGQGEFASGLSAALQEVAGDLESYAAIDYKQNESVQNLENRILGALESMKKCSGVLILCDLAGGIPFKTSVEVGYPRGCEVVAGANLGMLVEMNGARNFVSDVQKLADQAVTVGKDQVQKFIYNPAGAAKFGGKLSIHSEEQ